MDKNQIKNEIFQCGFFFLLGGIIGVILFSCFFTHQPVKEIVTEKQVIVHDTIVAKVTTPLNDSTLKAELKKNNIKHSNIVLAQAKLETGHYTSKVVKTHNNIFGIRRNGKYKRYDSWQDCVKDYKKCIQSRYNGGSYYAFLEHIGYAEDPAYTNKLKQIV